MRRSFVERIFSNPQQLTASREGSSFHRSFGDGSTYRGKWRGIVHLDATIGKLYAKLTPQYIEIRIDRFGPSKISLITRLVSSARSISNSNPNALVNVKTDNTVVSHF